MLHSHTDSLLHISWRTKSKRKSRYILVFSTNLDVHLVFILQFLSWCLTISFDASRFSPIHNIILDSNNRSLHDEVGKQAMGSWSPRNIQCSRPVHKPRHGKGANQAYSSPCTSRRSSEPLLHIRGQNPKWPTQQLVPSSTPSSANEVGIGKFAIKRWPVIRTLEARGNGEKSPELIWKVYEAERLKLVEPSENDLVEERLCEEFCAHGILDIREHTHCVLAGVPGNIGANDP